MYSVLDLIDFTLTQKGRLLSCCKGPKVFLGSLSYSFAVKEFYPIKKTLPSALGFMHLKPGPDVIGSLWM